MDVKIWVNKTLRPGIPSAKAYSLFFTDDVAYFILLGRDWRGFGAAKTSSPLADILSGAILSVAGAKSDIAINAKLKEIEGENFDEILAKNKGSVKTPYHEMVSIKSKKQSLWSGIAYILFETQNHGKFKFTFEDEEMRKKVISFMAQKRPDLQI